MLPTRLPRVAVVAFAVLAVACGDPTRPKATYANAMTSYTLYALTGTPAVASNALLFLGGSTRANGTFAFDVAFDLDSNGRTVIYPVRTLAGTLAGTFKRVGLQQVSGTFDALREVPATGYDTLGTKTLNPGTVLAVELRDPSACYSAISLVSSQFLYAKLVVDSVNTVARKIYLRTVIDPNCGYRSVVPDSVPTN
jgi:hypothetical protein